MHKSNAPAACKTEKEDLLLLLQSRNLCSKKKPQTFHSSERSPRYTVIYSFLCTASHSCEMVFCYKGFCLGEAVRGGEGGLSELSTSPSPRGVPGNPREHHPRCSAAALPAGTSTDCWHRELRRSGPGGSGERKPCCPHCRRALRLPRK